MTDSRLDAEVRERSRGGGEWIQSGMSHRGWACVDIEDLEGIGGDQQTCEGQCDAAADRDEVLDPRNTARLDATGARVRRGQASRALHAGQSVPDVRRAALESHIPSV
jgi:hypothetical protein